MHDRAVETFGLYSDGTLLVIDLQNYQLPQQCLISGERVESEPLPIGFYTWTVPPRGLESFGRGVVKSTWWLGPIQVIRLDVRAATISVGSSPTEIGLTSSLGGHSSLLSIYLLVLGTLIAMAGTILAAIGCFIWQWPWTLVPLSLVVGSLASISGVILLVRKNWPLRMRKVDSGFAWLVGVHPTLLASLPPWKNSSAYKTYCRSIGYQRLVWGGIALLIGAIPVVKEYQSIADAISSRQWLATQGAISFSKITSHRVTSGKNAPARTMFAPEVQYTFRVAGAVHTGNRINFGPQANHHDRRFASKALEREYPVGKPVTVFYHPREPARCTLRISTWDELRQKTWLSLAAFTIGAWALISGGSKLLRGTC